MGGVSHPERLPPKYRWCHSVTNVELALLDCYGLSSEGLLADSTTRRRRAGWRPLPSATHLRTATSAHDPSLPAAARH